MSTAISTQRDTAGEVCLYLANRLLTNYGKIAEITEVVDRNVFYIIPVVNVDGRAHFFADANTPSSNRGLRIPIDDDRDGLFDEDGPDDIDGDGSITNMRIRDTLGRLRSDPADPRLIGSSLAGRIRSLSGRGSARKD
jgi:hypothetical protein